MKSGSRKKARRLSRRDRSLLTHLALYRMTWLEVLQAKYFFGGKPDAVKSALRRLRTGKQPLIRSRQLYDQRVYYQLTYAGTRAIDATYRLAEALGRTTIIRQFALQSFFFLGNQEERYLLGQGQLCDLFDVQGNRLPKVPFYLASTGKEDKRLGFIMVDFGSEPRRCANRIVQRVLRLLQHSKIRSLSEAGVFELSVLTLTASKRRSLYEQLKVSKRSGGNLWITYNTKRVQVRLLIHVVPGLLELIPDSRE